MLRCLQMSKNIQQNLTKYAPAHIDKVLQELTTQEAIAVSRKCCCQVLLIVDNLISHFLDQFDQLTTRWTSDKKKQGRGFDCRVNCRLFIFYVFTAGLLFHFHSFYFWLLSSSIFCSFWTAHCSIIAVNLRCSSAGCYHFWQNSVINYSFCTYETFI